MNDIITEIKKVIPNLNDEQIQAITTTEQPLLIIAGPGTGKTLTLISRTIYLLLSQKAQPEEIILTTFTEKAAFELKDRLSQLARLVNYKGQLHLLKIGTIHSICNDFIGKFLSHTPLKKGYVILDDLTQKLFINQFFNTIIPEVNGKYFGRWENKWDTIDKIIPYFNKITEELIDISKLEKDRNSFVRLLAKSYKKYQQLLFNENKVDYSHIQKIFLDLLENKKVYPQIKGKFKYIMVDEYQDTNYIQERILLKLASPENKICVVGDEDQSLYRFRGATVRNILEFPKHFNNCKTIHLTTNYRSHKTIIDKNNKFITSIDWDNKYRYDKIIKPPSGAKFHDYPAIFAIWGSDEKDEAKRFVDLISFLYKNKIIQDWSNVALLLKSVRPEYSSHYIEALKKANIPYFCPRAKLYFENAEVKLMFACYALIFGFYDDKSEDYLHIDYLNSTITELGKYLNDPLKDYLRRKRNQIEELSEGSLDLNILDYFYQLLAYKPFSDFIKDKNKAHNLSIFSKLISVFQEYYGINLVTARNKDYIPDYLFKSFFYSILESGIDEFEDPFNPIPKGYVQIMTIHQSKGLEFPVVFVGTLHKQFSVQKEIENTLQRFSPRGTFEPPNRITEFDRLRHYYVAFSRAQNLLVLTTSEKPKDWFSPIWDGLDQYPYIETDKLKSQKFKSRPQFIPKKSYSISQINIYETCPQQYLFYKELDFAPSRSAQVLFGLLVHYTIEDLHRALLSKTKVTDKDIENWHEQNYRALLLSGLRPLSKTQKEASLKQVFNYYKQNKDLIGRLKETEVEVSIEKEDYIITGKIDLLISSGNNFAILDFKTQPRPENGSELIEKYKQQLCLYGYILQEKYNKPIDKMYIYWTSEEKRKDALMELKYTGDDVEKAGKYFDKIVSEIKRENFSVSTPPDTTKICKECDFRFYCSQNGIIKFKTKVMEE